MGQFQREAASAISIMRACAPALRKKSCERLTDTLSVVTMLPQTRLQRGGVHERSIMGDSPMIQLQSSVMFLALNQPLGQLELTANCGASGRADRARPAVCGMLGARTATVKRQMDTPDGFNRSKV